MDKEKALENQGSKFREDIEIGGGYLNLARRKFQSLMMRVTTQQLLLTVVIQLLPVQ